VKLCQWVTAT